MYLIMKPCDEIAFLCRYFHELAFLLEVGSTTYVALRAEEVSVIGNGAISVLLADEFSTRNILSSRNFVCAVEDHVIDDTKQKLSSADEWLELQFNPCMEAIVG